MEAGKSLDNSAIPMYTLIQLNDMCKVPKDLDTIVSKIDFGLGSSFPVLIFQTQFCFQAYAEEGSPEATERKFALLCLGFCAGRPLQTLLGCARRLPALLLWEIRHFCREIVVDCPKTGVGCLKCVPSEVL